MSNSTAETARMTKFYRGEFSALIGRKIIDVRAMYPEEMELFMWDGELGAVITLDDGGCLSRCQTAKATASAI